MGVSNVALNVLRYQKGNARVVVNLVIIQLHVKEESGLKILS
jgi:hypothetical protein